MVKWSQHFPGFISTWFLCNSLEICITLEMHMNNCILWVIQSQQTFEEIVVWILTLVILYILRFVFLYTIMRQSCLPQFSASVVPLTICDSYLHLGNEKKLTIHYHFFTSASLITWIGLRLHSYYCTCCERGIIVTDIDSMCCKRGVILADIIWVDYRRRHIVKKYTPASHKFKWYMDIITHYKIHTLS